MNQNIEFSIVVPTFNRAMITLSCVSSLLHILKNSPISYEIIVVDDGSTDNTEDVFLSLMKHAKYLRLVRTDKQKGQYRNPGYARNAGLKAAVGKYVCFCDGDILHLKDPLTPTRLAFSKNENAYVTGVHYRMIGETLDGPRGLNVDMPHGSWLAVNRELLVSLGGYDQRFMRYGNEDNDIVQRLRRRGLIHISITDISAFHPDFDSGRKKNALDDVTKELQMEIQRDTTVVRNIGLDWGVYRESFSEGQESSTAEEKSEALSFNDGKDLNSIQEDISSINDVLLMLAGKVSVVDKTFSLVNNIHRGVVSLEKPIFERKKHAYGGKEIFDICQIYTKSSIETDSDELLKTHPKAKKISPDSPEVELIVLSQLHRQRNVGNYLDVAYNRLDIGGEVIVICPAYSNNIGSGNLSGPWNAGHLLYNLVVAGFDCKEAKVSTFEHEIQIQAQKTYRKPTTFVLNELSDFFPFDIYQHFNGNIKEVNWS